MVNSHSGGAQRPPAEGRGAVGLDHEGAVAACLSLLSVGNCIWRRLDLQFDYPIVFAQRESACVRFPFWDLIVEDSAVTK